MNCRLEHEQFDIKNEEVPLSVTEIKTEPQDIKIELKTEKEECYLKPEIHSVCDLGSIKTISETQHEEYVNLQNENCSTYNVPQISVPTPQHPAASTLTYDSKQSQELQHVKQQMDQTFVSLQDTRKTDNDECDLYGKSIARKLRKIPESEREHLIYEIDEIFLKVNERYQNLSYIDYSSSSQASSTCVLSPVEVIQGSPPTSVFSDKQSMISQPNGIQNVESFVTLNESMIPSNDFSHAYSSPQYQSL